MLYITRILEFDAGHRLVGHEGKCRHLHGHRYKAEIVVSADSLDSIGRVIDFSVIKEKVGGWIDVNWDHNLLLNAKDPLAMIGSDTIKSLVGDRPPYLFANNPTAENIAKELFTVSEVLLNYHGIKVFGVRIWETPNCKADYFPTISKMLMRSGNE